MHPDRPASFILATVLQAKGLMDNKSTQASLHLHAHRPHRDFLRVHNKLHSPFTSVGIPVLVCGHHLTCTPARDTEVLYTRWSLLAWLRKSIPYVYWLSHMSIGAWYLVEGGKWRLNEDQLCHRVFARIKTKSCTHFWVMSKAVPNRALDDWKPTCSPFMAVSRPLNKPADLKLFFVWGFSDKYK